MAMEVDHPIQVGTRTKEQIRALGRTMMTWAEVIEYVPGQLVSFRSIAGPVRCEGFRQIEPAGGQTRLTYTLMIHLPPIYRLFEGWLRRDYQKRVRGDLVRLRERLSPVPVPDGEARNRRAGAVSPAM